MPARRRFRPALLECEPRLPLDATGGSPDDAVTGVYLDDAVDVSADAPPDDPGTDDPGMPPADPTDPIEPDPSPFDGDNPPTVPLPPAPVGPAGPAY